MENSDGITKSLKIFHLKAAQKLIVRLTKKLRLTKT